MLNPLLRLIAFILSCIIYALTIFSAYGGRFDTLFFTFPGIMVLFLPWLALTTLVITVIWLGFRKFIPGALGLLAIIISWGPVSTVSPLGSRKKPEPGAQTFTIMTYNIIHGWDQEKKSSDRNRTIDYIMKIDADVVCLQEVKKLTVGGMNNFTKAQYNELRKVYPYETGDSKHDMKVLSKYPVTYEKAEDFITGEFDKDRYTFYRLDINGHHLTLVNLHLMSFLLSDKQRNIVTDIHSIETAKESVEEFSGMHGRFHRYFKKRRNDVSILRAALDKIEGPLIVCGDFNDVPESYAYRLLKGNDLKDAYVETGFGPMVTYNQHAFWFHLDQILYRGPLKALDIHKGKSKVSDHYPVIAEFEFTDSRK